LEWLILTDVDMAQPELVGLLDLLDGLDFTNKQMGWLRILAVLLKGQPREAVRLFGGFGSFLESRSIRLEGLCRIRFFLKKCLGLDAFNKEQSLQAPALVGGQIQKYALIDAPNKASESVQTRTHASQTHLRNLKLKQKIPVSQTERLL
jgi:hypothetical protein